MFRQLHAAMGYARARGRRGRGKRGERNTVTTTIRQSHGRTIKNCNNQKLKFICERLNSGAKTEHLSRKMGRRLLTVAGSLVLGLASWAAVLLGMVPVALDAKTREMVFTLPLYLLVVFGCYSLATIGYNLARVNDCPDAAAELTKVCFRSSGCWPVGCSISLLHISQCRGLLPRLPAGILPWP